MKEENTQITLEDMMRINAHNRKMNLLLCSGLLFLAIGIIIAKFERMLETTTESLTYVLYRYIAVGQYDPAPVNYTRLMFPAILAGIVGVALCLCYFMKNRKKRIGKGEKRNEKTIFSRIGSVGAGISGVCCSICQGREKWRG